MNNLSLGLLFVFFILFLFISERKYKTQVYFIGFGILLSVLSLFKCDITILSYPELLGRILLLKGQYGTFCYAVHIGYGITLAGIIGTLIVFFAAKKSHS